MCVLNLKKKGIIRSIPQRSFSSPAFCGLYLLGWGRSGVPWGISFQVEDRNTVGVSYYLIVVTKETGLSTARGWAGGGLDVPGKSYGLPRGTENGATCIHLSSTSTDPPHLRHVKIIEHRVCSGHDLNCRRVPLCQLVSMRMQIWFLARSVG